MNSKSITRWISLGAVVLAFFSFDLLFPTLDYAIGRDPIWQETMSMAFFGATLCQVAGLALWAAFGPHRLLTRLIGALLSAVLVWCTIETGFNLGYAITGGASLDGRVQFSEPDGASAAFFGGLILINFIIMQAAMWLARLFCGWRLRDDGDESKFDATKFGLLQLMLWTAAVGVVLAICRAVLPDEGWSWSVFEFWWPMHFMLGVALIYPVVIAVPTVWFCLRKPGSVALRMLILGAITLGAALVEACPVAAVIAAGSQYWSLYQILLATLLIYLSMNIAFTIPLVCTLLVIRMWGYRLVGRQRLKDASSPAVDAQNAIV